MEGEEDTNVYNSIPKFLQNKEWYLQVSFLAQPSQHHHEQPSPSPLFAALEFSGAGV